MGMWLVFTRRNLWKKKNKSRVQGFWPLLPTARFSIEKKIIVWPGWFRMILTIWRSGTQIYVLSCIRWVQHIATSAFTKVSSTVGIIRHQKFYLEKRRRRWKFKLMKPFNLSSVKNDQSSKFIINYDFFIICHFLKTESLFLGLLSSHIRFIFSRLWGSYSHWNY